MGTVSLGLLLGPRKLIAKLDSDIELMLIPKIGLASCVELCFGDGDIYYLREIQYENAGGVLWVLDGDGLLECMKIRCSSRREDAWMTADQHDHVVKMSRLLCAAIRHLAAANNASFRVYALGAMAT